MDIVQRGMRGVSWKSVILHCNLFQLFAVQKFQNSVTRVLQQPIIVHRGKERVKIQKIGYVTTSSIASRISAFGIIALPFNCVFTMSCYFESTQQSTPHG